MAYDLETRESLGAPPSTDASGLSRYWDANAEARYRELSENTDAAYRALSHHVVKLVRDLRPPPSSLLDIGCGIGFLSAHLAASGYEVTGVDPSAESIRLAQRDHSPKVAFRNASVERFSEGVDAAYFDIAVANMVVHAAPNIDGFFAAAAYLLKPRAPIVVTLPHPVFYLATKTGSRGVGYSGHSARLVDFRLRDGVPHPSPIPFYDRTIREYVDAMRQAGFKHSQLVEKRYMGPGREFDVLTITATRA